MGNSLFKVKTRKQANIWIYSVVNGTGHTVASRRGFASEAKARDAGHAAAAALTPVPVSTRFARLRAIDQRPAMTVVAAPKKSFLQTLFG